MKYTAIKVLVLFSLCFAVFSPARVLAETADSATSIADSLLKAKKHFSFAVQYKKSGSLEQSLINYEQSLAYNDTVFQVHYSFADLLIKMDRPDEARREFALSLALNPNHFNSASMLAKLYYSVAAYDSALYAYEAMHRIKPEETAILTTIAGLREYLGLTKGALDAYESLINNGQATFDNRVKSAKLSMSLEDWDRADTHIKAALKMKPEDAETLSIATSISSARGNSAETISMLKRIAESSPDDLSALIRLENSARGAGDNETLSWALKRHIAVTEDNHKAYVELIDLLAANGNDSMALTYIDKALKSYPADGRFRILKGNYFRARGNNEKALAEYRIALSDEKWKSSAQQFIWQIEPPKTEDEQAEQEFFQRGNAQQSSRKMESSD